MLSSKQSVDRSWHEDAIMVLNEHAREQAQQRQSVLTKPPGALGELENIAIRLAAMQGTVVPKIEKPSIVVFAGDHGIVEEGVSAFPQDVTAQMVDNFVNGGAAISVLAKNINAHLLVVDAGVRHPVAKTQAVWSSRVANGTDNFRRGPAMSPSACLQALMLGKEVVDKLVEQGMDMFIGGEMGIGNTTSATALAVCATGVEVSRLTGPGTGLDGSGVAKKVKVITDALDRVAIDFTKPLECLAYFGGFEIIAMVGAYLRCAQTGIPILVDGFISSVAALYATRLNTPSRDWMLFGHQSKEPGHQHVLQALNAQPLLSLDMRLGEGSGAAVAYTVVQSALALHRDMATFTSAGVAEKLS